MPCPGDPGPRPDWIPAPNTARMNMRYSVFGQVIENVFHFKKDSPWDYGTLFDLATEAGVAWHANIKPLLPAAITLIDIITTDVEVEDGVQATVAISAPGTNAAAAFETTGNTFVTKFSTGRTGRSFRGRVYWPLLPATSVNDGQLVSTAVANQMSLAWGDFFADINSATNADHCITSYQNDCEWREEAVSTTVNGYSYSDLNLDSQRRRLPGRGT